MNKDTGGPAFPRPATWNHNSTKIIVADDGMNLRDYFAAKALAALIIGHAVKSVPVLCLVEDAYLFADAMIAERNKPENK